MSRSLLENIYLFKQFPAGDLNAVSELGEVVTFSPGETIFLRGEPAKAMFFIKFGSVKIQQSTSAGDNIDVATLSAGSHFGEMPFVDNEPRSATAIAAEQTELFVIGYEKLNAFLNSRPNTAVGFFKELAHFLCGRLRVTTSDLNYVREKNLSHF